MLILIMVVVVVVAMVVAWGSGDTHSEIWNSNNRQYLIWEPPDPCRWQATTL